MKFFLVKQFIFFLTAVHSFPFPSSILGDSESRAFSGASASLSDEGIDGFRSFGTGCSGNSDFPDGPDGYDGFDKFGGGFHREEHGDGGGLPFMMRDGFDATSMADTRASALRGAGGPPFMMGNGFDGTSMAGANAIAGTGANSGSPFLGSGVSGALGSATATANAAAGIDAGPKSAQSVAQSKSDTISTGNGVFSSATSFSSASAT